MQLPESQITQLTEILQSIAKELRGLQVQLAANRGAFVAIDARGLVPALEDLTPTWRALEQLEARRAEVCSRIGEAMHVEGSLRVSRLIGEIPPQSGRRLREAAAAAEAAARRVRAETNAGARLLRASRQTNEEIVRALSGGSNPGSSGYDNRANKVGVRADGGHLLTGTA